MNPLLGTGNWSYLPLADADLTGGTTYTTCTCGPRTRPATSSYSRPHNRLVFAYNLCSTSATPPNPYPTLLADNGARHTIVSGFHLGAGIDAEPDGQPTAAPMGMTTTGPRDDEDGVDFVNYLTAGRAATVYVTASQAGKLDAWIDFNRDGDWSDAGEQVFASQALAAGLNLGSRSTSQAESWPATRSRGSASVPRVASRTPAWLRTAKSKTTNSPCTIRW